MFCPKCGYLNLDKVENCQKCGVHLPAMDGTATAASVPQEIVAPGVYAGFWKRFAALILDYLLLLAVSVFTGAVIGLLAGPGEGADSLGGLATVAIWWLYYALMESSVQQATLGKMALGIRVTDGQGRRVSFGRATGRHFAKLLSGLILLIGYLMAGFTVRKQALHDMIAGCLVVNRGAPADLLEKGVKGGSMPGWAVALIIVGALFVPIAGIVAAITIPAYQDFTMRAKVAMAMVAGRGATRAVEEFYARNKSLPGDLKEAGAPAHDSNHVRSVTLDPRSGAVRVVLAGASVEGKSILFEPVREGDGRVTWTCGSADRDSPVINNVVDFLQWPPAL